MSSTTLDALDMSEVATAFHRAWRRTGRSCFENTVRHGPRVVPRHERDVGEVLVQELERFGFKVVRHDPTT